MSGRRRILRKRLRSSHRIKFANEKCIDREERFGYGSHALQSFTSPKVSVAEVEIYVGYHRRHSRTRGVYLLHHRSDQAVSERRRGTRHHRDYYLWHLDVYLGLDEFRQA